MKRKCEVILALVCNTDFNGQLNMIINTTQVVTTAPRHRLIVLKHLLMASSFTNQLVITSLAYLSIQSGLSQYSLTIVDSDDKQQSENNNRLKTRSNVSKAKKNNTHALSVFSLKKRTTCTLY